MEQEYKIAIIGAGASGSLCAYFLLNSGYEVTLFDKGLPLRTLLPTGGGRCNLAHAEFDPRELAKNYPRGEKFLYSVFSKFSTSDTLETFENLGLETYTQENGRIFPISNSAKEVRLRILEHLKRTEIIKEEVVGIEQLNKGFKISTTSENFKTGKRSQYYFSHVILATGGHSGYKLAESLGLNIISPRPSLVGLNTAEDFSSLSGTVIKNVNYNGLSEDLLFTHFGVSGPLIYTISSIKAFDKIPYNLKLDLCPDLVNLQEELNSNPHKEIKNILNKFIPSKLASYILQDTGENLKAHKIDGKTRDSILTKIHNFELTITGTNKGEETVTAGGIDLDEINSKTMESKKVSKLYCIGEVLNIDGFCGGFNLQNAWSTAYVCASSFCKKC